jgi:hypothetical protein
MYIPNLDLGSHFGGPAIPNCNLESRTKQGDPKT